MAIAATRQYPLVGTHAGFHRFTVAEYHKLIRVEMLTPDENLELIEGYIVHKLSRSPSQSSSFSRTRKKIEAILPSGWEVRLQDAITLSSSEPEPDIAIARGSDADYETRHPGPPDLALVVEISDSSLEVDRTDKQRIYARDAVSRYWIVNIPDRRVEVYADPQPAADPPCYASRTDYAAGTTVPLILDGATVGQIPVDEILP